MAREKQKTERRKQRKNEHFPPIVLAEFFHEFSVCVFRSENGKRRRKTVSQNFNIKFQHGTMIQSRMPTRWSCKPNQCAYECSKQDLEKRFFSSTRSSAPPLPIKKTLRIQKRVHFPKAARRSCFVQIWFARTTAEERVFSRSIFQRL